MHLVKTEIKYLQISPNNSFGTRIELEFGVEEEMLQDFIRRDGRGNEIQMLKINFPDSIVIMMQRHSYFMVKQANITKTTTTMIFWENSRIQKFSS